MGIAIGERRARAHRWMAFNLNGGFAQGWPYTKPIGTLEGFWWPGFTPLSSDAVYVSCVPFSALQVVVCLQYKASYGGRVSPPQQRRFGPERRKKEEKLSPANLVVSSLKNAAATRYASGEWATNGLRANNCQSR